MDNKNFAVSNLTQDQYDKLVEDAMKWRTKESTLLRTLNAIKARINGEYDNPDLMSFGPLSTVGDDCLEIIRRVSHAIPDNTSVIPNAECLFYLKLSYKALSDISTGDGNRYKGIMSLNTLNALTETISVVLKRYGAL